jgi:hypothetical protein
MKKIAINAAIEAKVTNFRLLLFTMDSYLEITEVAQLFWLLFSKVKVCINRLHFGLFFTNSSLVTWPWRHGAVDIISASGTEDPSSNPARVYVFLGKT